VQVLKGILDLTVLLQPSKSLDRAGGIASLSRAAPGCGSSCRQGREHMEEHRSVPLGACLSCAKHELSRAAVTSNEHVLVDADISKEPVNLASDYLI